MDFLLLFKLSDMILKGALTSIEVTLLAITLGLVLGIIFGMARIAHRKWLQVVADVYIQVIRGTPMLLQIFFFFLGLPQIYTAITGNYLSPNPFVVGTIALGINSGAYTAEIIRAGIQSIDKGQSEAAYSLGMPYAMVMSQIILPQALRCMIPPLGSELIILLKDSSLISTIGVADLMFTAKILGSKYYTYVPFLLGAGIVYLVLTILISRSLNILERRMTIHSR